LLAAYVIDSCDIRPVKDICAQMAQRVKRMEDAV
jgi:hypothetical protein